MYAQKSPKKKSTHHGTLLVPWDTCKEERASAAARVCDTLNPIVRMVCIGTGPGPKNVLVEDCGRLFVTSYREWKQTYSQQRRNMEIEGTVGTVEARRTNGDPLYIIPIDGTDYSTFEKPLALQAKAGEGLRGKFATEQKPNPNRPEKPYNNLLAVIGWYGTPKEGIADIPFQQQNRSGGGGRGRSYGKTPEERKEIARMNANNVAFSFIGKFAEAGAFADYGEAERTALALSDKLFTNGQFGETTPTVSEPQQLSNPGGLTPPTPGEQETWGQ